MCEVGTSEFDAPTDTIMMLHTDADRLNTKSLLLINLLNMKGGTKLRPPVVDQTL